MSKFIIISDSTCDLTNEILKEFDIKVMKAHYNCPWKKDSFSSNDWEDLKDYTSTEFYTKLRECPEDFSTSCCSVDEIANEFKNYVKDGYDILAVTITSKMSGSYNNYLQAKKLVLDEFKNAKIEVVDSLKIGPAVGLLEVKASELRAKGNSLEDTAKWLNENVRCFHQIGWLDDLYFVAKKGRIKNYQAFFGRLIGIKPIGDLDSDGYTTILGKARNEAKGFEAIVNYVKETVIDEENNIAIICHTLREKPALKLKQLIEEKFHFKKVYFKESTPSNGINIGPGLVAIYYFGIKSSDGLVEEQKIIEKYI